jgi:hypothetical protein
MQGTARYQEAVRTHERNYNSCKKMLQNHALSPVSTPVKTSTTLRGNASIRNAC